MNNILDNVLQCAMFWRLLEDSTLFVADRPGESGTFGIWSLRWGADGREIIAGTGDYSVYVYDLERRKVCSPDRLAHNAGFVREPEQISVSASTMHQAPVRMVCWMSVNEKLLLAFHVMPCK